MKLQIAITSMVCMIVAMGMGRFALTPQLPHMIAERQINLTQASLLAAANFLGYLLGAIETISAKRHLILRLKCGLWGSAIILLISALIPTNAAGIYVDLLLRFVAGIASAWTLVLISTWVQEQLGSQQDHSLRTLAFSGPGAGIILTGIIALGLDYCHASAALNWLIFGVVALIASFFIYKDLPSSLPEVATEERFPMTGNSNRLLISYALCGVAYVLPATFLSKLAVDQFPGMLVANAFWPLFGFAVIAGMTLLAAQRDIKNPQQWLAWIFCVQGMGVLACTLLHGLEGLLIGTLLVGGSFMVILQLTMRLGAELAPHHLRAITGVLTTGFAVGQLIGPLLSALSTHFCSSMTPALLFAAFGAFLAALLVYSIRPLKVVTLILLTAFLLSPKAYCQEESDAPQISTIVGKVIKMDLDSDVVNVEAGTVSKEIFSEAHLDADLLWAELIKSGYIDANGEIQVPFYRLVKFSDMVLSKDFNAKKKLIYKIFENAYMDNGEMKVLYIYFGSELLQGTHRIASIEIEQGDPVTIQYDSPSSEKNNVIRLVDGK